jgi:hypothetical protein
VKLLVHFLPLLQTLCPLPFNVNEIIMLAGVAAVVVDVQHTQNQVEQVGTDKEYLN